MELPGEIGQSLNNVAKDIEKRMDTTRHEINMKIDKMGKSTDEELKKMLKLITTNEEKKADRLLVSYCIQKLPFLVLLSPLFVRSI